MGEFTTCNYCNLQSIKTDAKKSGSRVYKRASSFLGGTDIFVVPNGKKLPPKDDMIEPCDKYPDGNEAFSKYHRAWLMEIPNRCCC